MIDEEIRKLAKESWWNDDCCSGAMTTEKIYEHGFLAGLKAGRPKWHDLRKDPNDLPSMIRDEREISQNVWIHIKNWGTECSYYSYHRKVWMVRCREVNLPVLAWCEIPEYTEE